MTLPAIPHKLLTPAQAGMQHRLAKRDDETPAPASITLGPLNEQPELFATENAG